MSGRRGITYGVAFNSLEARVEQRVTAGGRLCCTSWGRVRQLISDGVMCPERCGRVDGLASIAILGRALHRWMYFVLFCR